MLGCIERVGLGVPEAVVGPLGREVCVLGTILKPQLDSKWSLTGGCFHTTSMKPVLVTNGSSILKMGSS